MRIENCSNGDEWENFIAKNKPNNFLQSFWWGDVLEKEGRQIERFAVRKNKKILALFILEKKVMTRGGFFYFESLWGPVWNKSLSNFEVAEILEEIHRFIGKKDKSIFWRFSPPASTLISPKDIESNYYFENDFLEANFCWNFFPTMARTRPPKKTLVIDLTQEDARILSQMKGKTRYNIKLAAKKGVEVVWSDKEKDLKEFFKLHLITAERGGFKPHSFEHYLNILKTPQLLSRNKVLLALAKHDGKIICANMILFFNETVFYLHGASGNESRNLMGPYLLHYEAIKRAKEEGFKNYDFWGVDNNKWAGVSRFKEGFGGHSKYYQPIYEWPLLDYYYKMYCWYRKLRER